MTRFYGNRALIQNDGPSYRRVKAKFLTMQENLDELSSNFANSEGLEVVEKRAGSDERIFELIQKLSNE
jgi:hypothetical protein